MGDCFGTGYVLEECHVEEARVARGIEGVRRGDLLEFFARSNDDGCADAEPLDNGPSHEFGHAFNQVRRSVNHYVPALNVGAHSRAADGSEDVPQLHHWQPVLAADIDTAKERDISPFAKCHGPLALSDHAPRTVELSLRVNPAFTSSAALRTSHALALSRPKGLLVVGGARAYRTANVSLGSPYIRSRSETPA